MLGYFCLFFIGWILCGLCAGTIQIKYSPQGRYISWFEFLFWGPLALLIVIWIDFLNKG
jgi:hypothetical protein